MSKNANRKRQAKPVRVSPLIAGYVQSLAPASATSSGAQPSTPLHAARRELLLSKAWRGVTVNRYRDGCELVFADGRSVQAPTALKLLWRLVSGGVR